MAMELKLQQFRNYLSHNRNVKSQLTLDSYCNMVETLNDWLISQKKAIDVAKEEDLIDWFHTHNNSLHFYSIKAYYDFINAELQANIITKLKADLLKKRQKNVPLIREWQFRKYLAESGCKNEEHLALFQLLWSEMELDDFFELRKSDFNFNERFVTANGKRYYLTCEAWEILEKIAKERGKNERLFRMTNVRQARSVVKQYLGSHNLSAKSLWKSCKREITILGRAEMFIITEDNPVLSGSNNEQASPSLDFDFFDALISKIRDFGAQINPKITKLTGKNGENNLQRLLEGYLTAVFPNEKVVSEFAYHGWKESEIDFVIGEKEIPIEVKLHKNMAIGDSQRAGFAQVKEFMKHNNSERGILVIGDAQGNPKNKKFNGVFDNVYTIVI